MCIVRASKSNAARIMMGVGPSIAGFQAGICACEVVLGEIAALTLKVITAALICWTAANELLSYLRSLPSHLGPKDI